MTTCFVIGPIGDSQADSGSPGRVAYETAMEIYETVVVAACAELGIEAIRADQISASGDITDQVFRRLYEADVVIADLSGGNANVMYELGLRHSLNALTVQIADRDTPLPFDVNAVRTILVKRSPLGLIEARKRLVQAIQVGLSAGPELVAATRVWEASQLGLVDQIASVLEPATSAEDEDNDEEGFIDRIAGVIEAFPRLTASTEGKTKSIEDIGGLTSLWGGKVNDLNAANAPMPQRLAAIKLFAQELKPLADGLDESTVTFRGEVVALDRLLSPLIIQIAENPALQNDDIETFFESIEELAESGRTSMEGLGGFAASAKQLGTLSRDIRPSGNKIATAAGRVVESVGLIENWAFAIERLRASPDREGS